MTVGIVSYLSKRGLGTMAHDLRQQLGINRQLVIPDGPDWPYSLEWANGEEFYLQQWEIAPQDLEAWQSTDKIDTLVSIETGFGDRTFKTAKELGMRTILIVMWESFNPNLPAYQNVDLYVCPSYKAFQEVPRDNKIFLPYPVDLDEFPFIQRSGPAKIFIHNAGSGGMNGRKGTRETIRGFIKADVPGATLLVRCQEVFSRICPEFDGNLPSNVKIDYGSRDTRAELYDEGDVLIYPSHYDGHSLVGLEGMASGLPVITTDAEPMNEFWTPGYQLCVKAAEHQHAGTVNPHCLAHKVDIDDLAEKIRWCAENDMSTISEANRAIVERDHSWSVLRDRWKKVIGV
jgi:glycosyltransferase involved in cell wall biosynthesis